MLPWSHVCERMGNSPNYWISTAALNGRPHTTPVWGVWLDDTLYFDGSPETRRGRDIASNPAISVHLESGDDVVILEGEAEQIRGVERPDLVLKLAAAYSAKYAAKGYEPTPDTWDEGGLYVLRPRIAFAWTKFPDDATRWYFPISESA